MTASATTPSRTLARLSFWVLSERMGEFETAYRMKVVPILERHELVASPEKARAGPEHIFSRLFELRTPSDAAAKQEALSKDPGFGELLRELGKAFGASLSGGMIRWQFGIYTTPAGTGKTVSAGPGKVTCTGTGKVVPAGPGRGHWRTFVVANGLTDRCVLSMFQDREAHLWFGTRDGVSRYDGKVWTIYTSWDGLAGGYVWAMGQDREGHLWFGTGYEGVSRYDGKRFTTYNTGDGLAGNWVSAILQDDEGYLWFGTSGGVSRYDPTTGSQRRFVNLTDRDGLAGNWVTSILQDDEGYLWFGTRDHGISRYDKRISSKESVAPFTTFTTSDGLASNSVTSILQDKEGHLWFGTGDRMGFGKGIGGVSRYDRVGRRPPNDSPDRFSHPNAGESSGKGTFTTFTEKDGLGGNDVQAIVQDLLGNLWFGTRGGGLSRYDGKAFSNFTTRDGLASNLISCILQDREGHLWLGSMGDVSRYDGHSFSTFTPQDGLAGNVVRSVIEDREGCLWFGTNGGGVSRYDRDGRGSGGPSGAGTFTTLTWEDGLADNWVNRVFQDREGNLWFGTLGGASRYDGRYTTTFTEENGLGRYWIRSIFQDKEGNLWFGTMEGGVSRYDGKSFTNFATFATPRHGLGGDSVNVVFQDREGNLWFATNGGGVSRYDGKEFSAFTVQDGLTNDVVHAILQDREGNFWFGTDDGVSRYDGRSFTSFTVRDGLAGMRVDSIIQDRQGHLWFSSDVGGVSRYDGQVFQTMTRQDGLADNGVWSIFQDREGNLWFGTLSNGVTRYRPSEAYPPPVFIEALVADRRYEGVAEIEVPSFVNLIVFEFHGISFKTRPEQMVYRYRLKGHEEAWRNTRERRVEYQELPAGTYRFEVLAVDRDLVYSERPATVRLTVVQDPRDRQIDELEQRVRERTRELQEANKALSDANRALFEANVRIQEATQRKSRFLASMSHELRTPMNAIVGFTNLVLRRRSENLTERQRDNLVKVRQSADDLLDLINDLLDLSKIEAGRMEVRSGRFRVKGLIASCCETVGLLVKPGVTLIRDVADDVGTADTDEAKVRQIVINLLSNALKFTEKGEVKVRVASPRSRVESRGFSPELATRDQGPGAEGDRVMEIAVSDTGIGIPAEAMDCIFEEFRQVEGESRQEKGTGLGLSITKKLTELLGGTIGVEREAGKGSTFTVRLPITYRTT